MAPDWGHAQRVRQFSAVLLAIVLIQSWGLYGRHQSDQLGTSCVRPVGPMCFWWTENALGEWLRRGAEGAQSVGENSWSRIADLTDKARREVGEAEAHKVLRRVRAEELVALVRTAGQKMVDKVRGGGRPDDLSADDDEDATR